MPSTAKVVNIAGEVPTNGAESIINASLPYTATVAIQRSGQVRSGQAG